MPCRATPPARFTSQRYARISVHPMQSIRPGHFPIRWLHPSRRGQEAAPPDEVLDPHGEERGNAARLEPRGHGIRHHDSTQEELVLVKPATPRPLNARQVRDKIAQLAEMA